MGIFKRFLWTLSGLQPSRVTKLLMLSSLVFAIACGDDSGTSANDNQVECREQPSTDAHDRDAESCATRNDEDPSSSSSSSWSSSSVTLSPSTSSGLAPQSAVSNGSSNSKSSSSAKIASSSSNKASSSSLSSSSVTLSSSSEYVPFDHSKTLAEDWRVGENAYHQFTDTRNGRSYYYIKIIGKNRFEDRDSVTIMAENLNIGKMVPGIENQSDDNEIERYCYGDDSTKCDEFGGLYQWAEMMQLPSRCNTESCKDLIQEKHRGICPEGWRLMTYNDFYIAWHAETNEYGIKGTRSSYGFGGNNYTGLSLTGAGLRKAGGGFDKLQTATFWAYPGEAVYENEVYTLSSYVSALTDHSPASDDMGGKELGRSVRCVKLEQ